MLQQQQQQEQQQQQQQQEQGSLDEDAPEYVGYLHARKPGDAVHCCVHCSFPVAVFGRLYPCLHACCLACASEMDACFLCQAPINRIERYPREGGIFISPATLQSFKSEDELLAHTRKVHQHLSVAAVNAERRAAAAARARAEAAAKAKQADVGPVGGEQDWAAAEQQQQQQQQHRQQQQQQQQLAAQLNGMAGVGIRPSGVPPILPGMGPGFGPGMLTPQQLQQMAPQLTPQMLQQMASSMGMPFPNPF